MLKVSVQNSVILMLRGDAMVVTEKSCFAHGGSFHCDGIPRTQFKGERAYLILDHGLGGFSLSLAGPIALGTEVKLHSMRECG